MNTTATSIAPSDVLVSSVVLEFCANGWDALATKISVDYTGLDIDSLKTDIQDYDDAYQEQHRQFWTKTMSLKEVESCIKAHYDTVTDYDYDRLFGPQVQSIIKRSERAMKVNAILYQ